MANKDFFDGKWHVTIPFEHKAKDDEVGMIDMAGLDPRDIRMVRIGGRRMRAWVVEVESEELYRAIMQPIWADTHYAARRSDTVSLDQLIEENDFDIAADDSIDPAHQYEEKSFLAELWEYLDTLGDEDRIIAEAILTKRNSREVMAELGITKYLSYYSRKMKMRLQLQERFADWR